MNEIVETALHEVLSLWRQMQRSDTADAGGDADRFQMKFYELVDVLHESVKEMTDLPIDADAARTDARFKPLFESLPDPLQIPFETELDAVLEGRDLHIDSSEQS